MTGLNHVYRNTRNYPVKVFLLGPHKVLHARRRPLSHQHNPRLTEATEHEVLVTVSRHRLLLNNPASTHRVHCRTGTARLPLNLGESCILRAPAQNQHRHNSRGRNTKNKERNPVIQQHAHRHKHEQGQCRPEQQNPPNVRVGLLRHLVDLLHLGERSLTFRLLLLLFFICHGAFLLDSWGIRQLKHCKE